MLEYLIRFLETLQAWFAENPSFSVVAFAGIFLGLQLFMIPVAPMSMAAGFFFGFGKGWLALMLGCALGATLNYWISRRFARERIRARFGNGRNFRLIETAIAREGWRIVLLLRFVPIPFGLANYCYGLTPVRYVPYILASCTAIIPANSLFVWMGSSFQGELHALLGKGRPRHWAEYVFLIAGIVAAVIALKVVAGVARNAVTRDEPGA